MEEIKLIVAGWRDFEDFDYGFKCIEYMLTRYNPNQVTIICGKAKGGDRCGELYYERFKSLGMTIEFFVPNWNDISVQDACIKKNKFGKPYNAKAGMDCNHKMGDTATHLIAFWDGKSKGTKDMIAYMRKLDKPVKIFNY